MAPSRSGRLPINGLDLHHEVYGELGGSDAVPLLLIPGAFLATGSMAAWAERFAADRPVVVFDQQGHGRTPDTSRPMSSRRRRPRSSSALRYGGGRPEDARAWTPGSTCRRST